MNHIQELIFGSTWLVVFLVIFFWTVIGDLAQRTYRAWGHIYLDAFWLGRPENKEKFWVLYNRVFAWAGLLLVLFGFYHVFFDRPHQ